MESNYVTKHGRVVMPIKTFSFPITIQKKRSITPKKCTKNKVTKKVVKKKIVQKLKAKKIKYKKKFKKTKRQQFPQVIRNSVCSSQRWTCGCCKELLGECIIIDHKVPLCFGGSNDISNLQALCPTCDKFKTGWLDYKILKNVANDGLITPNQVSELQHEYFNKIMGGNSITKKNDVYETQSIQNFQGKNININFNGIKINIQI